MPALLVTNHKGGVGKTFVAVHLAKSLSESGERVLLVDCDGQYDAFHFFARRKPRGNGEYHKVSRTLALTSNGDIGKDGKRCQPLSSFAIDESNYDHIILDGDAGLGDAVRNIVQNQIDIVVAPVNTQSLSIENLDELLFTVAKIFRLEVPYKNVAKSNAEEKEKARRRQSIARSIASHMYIVPLAANEQRLSEKLAEFRVKVKCMVAENMESLPTETDEALLNGKLIWELASLSDEKREELRNYFVRIGKELMQMTKQLRAGGV